MDIIILDGSKMTNIEETHKYISKELMLPTYYGNNLDALYDELTSINNKTHIVVKNLYDLVNNLGDYSKKLIKVFEDADEENDKIRIEISDYI